MRALRTASFMVSARRASGWREDRLLRGTIFPSAPTKARARPDAGIIRSDPQMRRGLLVSARNRDPQEDGTHVACDARPPVLSIVRSHMVAFPKVGTNLALCLIA